jgi:preprotein translocase subunit SecG
MNAIFWILIVAHVALCFLLILLVLVQNDKMGGLAGLGGMTAQSAFSTAGAATFIQKLTRYVAFILFVVVLSLSVMATKQDGSPQKSSVLQDRARMGLGAILDGNPNFPIEDDGAAPPVEK